jgi:hypothetical protein
MTLWLWWTVWCRGSVWSAGWRYRSFCFRLATTVVTVAAHEAGRPITRVEAQNVLDHFGIWCQAYGLDQFVDQPARTVVLYFQTADWPRPPRAEEAR